MPLCSPANQTDLTSSLARVATIQARNNGSTPGHVVVRVPSTRASHTQRLRAAPKAYLVVAVRRASAFFFGALLDNARPLSAEGSSFKVFCLSLSPTVQFLLRECCCCGDDYSLVRQRTLNWINSRSQVAKITSGSADNLRGGKTSTQ